MRAALSALVVTLASAHALAAPGSPDQKFEFTNTAMGTVVSVYMWTDDATKAKAGADAVFEEMKRLDGVMTTWTDTSEVSKINLAAGQKPVVVSDETYAVIARAVAALSPVSMAMSVTPSSCRRATVPAAVARSSSARMMMPARSLPWET